MGIYISVDKTAEADDNIVEATMMLFDAATGIRYDPGIPVRSSEAELSRNGDEVWADINTKRLPPGEYTNWWVVFNNPSACADGVGACTGGDLGNPAVNAA